jgi:hypothetical protein
MTTHQKPHMYKDSVVHVDESDSDTNIMPGGIAGSKARSGAGHVGFGANIIIPATKNVVPTKASKNEQPESRLDHLAERMYEDFDYLRTSSPEHSDNEESQGKKVGTQSSGCVTRPSRKEAHGNEVCVYHHQSVLSQA